MLCYHPVPFQHLQRPPPSQFHNPTPHPTHARCGNCEKCAFVYLLFAAWLPAAEIMSRVFGVAAGVVAAGPQPPLTGVYDMFDSPAHVRHFESLMGLAGHKPLECVGTPEECLAALYLARGRNYGGGKGGGGEEGAGGGEEGGPDGRGGCGCGGVEQGEKPQQQGSGEGSEGDGGGEEGSGGGAEDGEGEGQEGQLPLLFRLHGELIERKGREASERIKAGIEAVDATGVPGVPHLYPDWYCRGLMRAGKGAGGTEEGQGGNAGGLRDYRCG